MESPNTEQPIRSKLQEKDLLEALDHCFANIWITDAEGNIMYSNKGTSSSLSLADSDMLSSTAWDLESKNVVQPSATVNALTSKSESIRFAINPNDKKTAVITTPIFNEDGSLKMVIGNAFEDDKFNAFLNTLASEKTKLYEQAISRYIKNINSTPNVIAYSKRMLDIFAFASKISKSDSTIVIYGESGTGKDVVARYIHQNSDRKDEVFLPLNCAAIPSELMESELFGYEKGAFSGASNSGRIGLLGAADSGTLFLDEIGEMPLALQAKLLRVLETRDYRPVGGSTLKKTNARIIAATNRDLAELVKEGKFREDLYYRINVLPITMPPLRERKEDIIPLAETFLKDFNTKYNHTKHFTNDAFAILLQYDWPGNIRELKNIIERISLIVPDDIITLSVLENIIGSTFATEHTDSSSSGNADVQEDDSSSLKKVLLNFEKAYITKTLQQNDGNVEATAKILQVDKSGLYKKIKQWNIPI